MQLAALMGSELPALPMGGATEILGLTADSRAVKPGFLFAALPGTKFDGSRFIPQALEQGAAALLVPQGTKVEARVPVIAVGNPRRRLALMAARFFGKQPGIVAAVTGTNGKTSVATFVRQIWAALGVEAASLGTLGIESGKGARELGFTTPDPVALQAELAALADEGVTHLAMEASSHGLAQYRLDGVKLAAAGFTNITRDHMDYHTSFDDYLYAKLRLFGEVMGPGGVAVINADSAQAAEFEALCWARGHRIISVGRKGRGICLIAARPTARGQALELVNALVAAGLVIGCGGPASRVFEALANLKGARGRMEEAAHLPNGASVYIDYAHTPDALQNMLEAMRPHATGKLAVVFGCGGDRDAGKRPQMGEIAARLADIVYVTDDNPRGEEAGAIRAAILKACPGATEIGDRAAAIETAVRALQPRDLLVVAGKGHEAGQIVGDKVIPFSDHDAIAAAAQKIGGRA